jgi:hypothetical protein
MADRIVGRDPGRLREEMMNSILTIPTEPVFITKPKFDETNMKVIDVDYQVYDQRCRDEKCFLGIEKDGRPICAHLILDDCKRFYGK